MLYTANKHTTRSGRSLSLFYCKQTLWSDNTKNNNHFTVSLRNKNLAAINSCHSLDFDLYWSVWNAETYTH